MIAFHTLTVNNFYSIAAAELDFKTGLFEVVGVNNTEEGASSNGSGKTTLLIALLQCLYNKNPKENDIESTYNHVTGRPYTISVQFSHKDTNYVVTNDREAGKIAIIRDDIDITPKGIKAQLLAIEGIIGVPYEIFTAMYYITDGGGNALLDSSSKLLTTFLNLEAVAKLGKVITERAKDIKTQVAVLSNQVETAQRLKNSLEFQDTVDITALKDNRTILLEVLAQTEDPLVIKKIEDLSAFIAAKKEEQHTNDLKQVAVNVELKQVVAQHALLSSGKCPTCGSAVEGLTMSLDEQQSTLVAEKELLEAQKDTITAALSTATSVLLSTKSELEERKRDIKQELAQLNKQIVIAETRESTLEAQRQALQGVLETAEAAEKELELLTYQVAYAQGVVKLCKSGELTARYVHNFVVILANELKRFAEIMQIDNFSIHPVAEKGGIVYTIERDSVEIPYNALSAGEKARCRLLILSATLSAVEVSSGFKLNVIVLDEMLGALDTMALDSLRLLLDYYRTTKWAALVGHGNTLDGFVFDAQYFVEKNKGVSSVRFVE